ncbi:unnamed protein product [Rhizophagus irregularis]|nr:unnamed protein product [Rhizophagus irregularis]
MYSKKCAKKGFKNSEPQHLKKALAPHNTTPNDTRNYSVTYSELNPSENIRILDYQLPHHYNLIQQQIQQQQVRHPVYQQNDI